MSKMEDRLDGMVERYNEINDKMMDNTIVSDRKAMAKLGREQRELTPIIEVYQEYKQAKQELADAKELSKEDDKEIREMALMEVEELEPKIQDYLDRLEILLVPKIQTILITVSLRFVELLVVMKEISLRVIYSVCM